MLVHEDVLYLVGKVNDEDDGWHSKLTINGRTIFEHKDNDDDF